MGLSTRRRLCAAIGGAWLAALGVGVVALRAAPPPDLLQSAAKDTQAAPLKHGTTYQASLFPLEVRVTTAATTWWADQYRTTQRAVPRYGWMQFGAAGVKGLVTFVTGYGTTPSVDATIARLQAGGSHEPGPSGGGTRFTASRPVTIAGRHGREFDGDVWGIYGHTFVPFTPKTHGASPADSWSLHKGEAYRVVALDVGGKTVVVFLESAELPQSQFPAFRVTASRLLASIRFVAR
jgi:hypothetical protein